MEGYITDGQAGRLIDNYAIPHLKDNNFNTGLIELQKAVINHITEKIENGSIGATTQESEENSVDFSGFSRVLSKVIYIMVGILAVLGVIILILKNRIRRNDLEVENKMLKKELEESHRDMEDRVSRETHLYREKVEKLESRNRNFETEIEGLNSKLGQLNDDFNRAIKLHPNLESEIQDMKEQEQRQIDMEEARKVNDIVSKVISLSPSYKIFENVQFAYESYSNLTNSQKQYVDFDFEKLSDLYKQSEKLKIKHEEEERIKELKILSADAVALIVAIIGDISEGTSSNFEQIKEAKEIYDNLDEDVANYFDSETKNKLDRLYEEAKRAQDEEDEEERQRREEEERRRRSSSSSSFSHSRPYSSSISRSFSGHGGHTSGGGASRHF